MNSVKIEDFCFKINNIIIQAFKNTKKNLIYEIYFTSTIFMNLTNEKWTSANCNIDTLIIII